MELRPHYLLGFGLLQGKRIDLQRSSAGYSSVYSTLEKEFEVDGISLSDVTKLNESIQAEPKPARASMGNLTSYESALASTKHRLNMPSSAPQKLTHTIKRPHIVIPCHTNIECTLCQLYDESSDGETIEDQPTEEPPKQPSDAQTLEVDKQYQKNLMLTGTELTRGLTHNAIFNREKYRSLPRMATGNDQQEVTSATHSQASLLDSFHRAQTEYGRSITTQRRCSDRRIKPTATSTSVKSDSILPKIYKLRYTKSLHLAARPPGFNLPEAAAAQ